MVFALTSRSSNETSGLRGTWSVSWDSALMMLDSLRKFWVAQGKERQLLEIKGEVAQPHPTEGDGQNNVKPRWHSAGSKLRTRHPEEIHEAHENQPYGDLGEHLCVALHFFLLLSEEVKRNAKVLPKIAVWLIFMRLVDLFWMTRPEFTSRAVPTWLDVVLPIALGGLWLGYFAFNLKQLPLLPLG